MLRPSRCLFPKPQRMGPVANWLNRISDRPRKLLDSLALPYRFCVYGPTMYMVHSPTKDVQNQIKTRLGVVLGDLHGSWYKLLETLVTADLISMSPKTAYRLRACHEELETLIAVNPTLSASVDPANHRRPSACLRKLNIMQTMRWKDEKRQLLCWAIGADRSRVVPLRWISFITLTSTTQTGFGIWWVTTIMGGYVSWWTAKRDDRFLVYAHYSMDRALNLATDNRRCRHNTWIFAGREVDGIQSVDPNLFTHAPIPSKT
ncbi:MAG: hypothetical protein R2857_11550 [Vampirovibrionales bacterium]